MKRKYIENEAGRQVLDLFIFSKSLMSGKSNWFAA